MNRRHRIILPQTNPAPEGAANSNVPPANANEPPPVFCPVEEWCARSGLSRSATYTGIGEGWLPTIKMGKTRLIDFHPAIEAIRVKFSTSRAA